MQTNDDRQMSGGVPLWPLPDDPATEWWQELHRAMDQHMANYLDRHGTHAGGSAEWEQSETYRELIARRPSPQS